MSLERSDPETLVKRRGPPPLRQRLGDAEEVLAEVAERIQSARGAVRLRIADMLEPLKEEIQRQPKVSLVRGASVCLHNLIVSLRSRSAVSSAVLIEEVAAARDAIAELLRDPIFGLSERDLMSAARRALAKRGIERPLCGHERFRLELQTHLARPFPDDPLFPMAEVPVAALTCCECGLLTVHRLDMLGVLPSSPRL